MSVFSNFKRWGSQIAAAIVSKGADSVLLKPKADPGASPYLATSASIALPAKSVKEKGTDVATKSSAYTSAHHLVPLVLIGKVSLMPKDNPTIFMSDFAPKTFIEKDPVVVHLTEAYTTALHAGSAALTNMLNNAVKVMKAMASWDLAKEMGSDILDEVKGIFTWENAKGVAKDAAWNAGGAALGALAPVTFGASEIPGAVVQAKALYEDAKRVAATAEQAAHAAEQAADVIGELSGPPLTDAQANALAKKTYAMGPAVISILRAFFTKAATALKKKNADEKVKTKEDKKPANSTTCPCSSSSPVAIATGEKILTQQDFSLGGSIAISWLRRYRSGDPRTDGWFGQGWSHPLATELWLQAEGLQYFDAQGRAIELPLVEVGTEHFEAYDQLTVIRPNQNRWELRFNNGETHVFHRFAAGQWRLSLCEIKDRNGNSIDIKYASADFDQAYDSFATPPRPIYIEDSAGRRLDMHWSQARQLVAVVFADGSEEGSKLVSYSYVADPRGGRPNLSSQMNPTGQERSFQWQNHLLVGYTLATGQRYRNEYDQPNEQLSPDARVTLSEAVDDGIGNRFTYAHNTTWVEDYLGRQLGYAYNERKDIVGFKNALGHVTEMPFDSNGHSKGTTDPLGRSTSTVFDRRGNLTQLIDAAGSQTKLEYNALDLPIKITDAMGGTWLREYDERGNLIESADPLGHTTRYEINARGQVVAIVDAIGKRKTLEWDTRGNLTAFTDCSNKTTRFEFNPLGHLTSTTDALGQVTRYETDSLGRVVKVIQADGAEQRYQWDGEGNLIQHTDPLGQRTQWRYNGGGSPLERIDAMGHLVRYQYDAGGRLVRLTNEAGAHTHFVYDLLNRLTDEIGFDGRHQRYIYNKASELTHVVEQGGSDAGPGKITVFERDALSRLVAKRHEGTAIAPDFKPWEKSFTHALTQVESYKENPVDAVNANFAYDKLGRLTEASNTLATVLFAYDPVGNLLAETQALSLPDTEPKAYTFNHTYDSLDNRTSTKLPNGKTLNNLFYGSGHLHQINVDGQVISDFERDNLHREVSRTQGNLLSQFAYDPAGRLAAQRVGIAHGEREVFAGLTPSENGKIKSYDDLKQVMTGMIERQYNYDPSGQLRQILDKQRGSTRYGYDEKGRIVSSVIGLGKNWGENGTRVGESKMPAAANETFNWDAASNPIERPEQGQALTAVKSNRLEIWQDQRFEYDVHGNMIQRIQGKRNSQAQTITKFIWDAAHQLQSAVVTRGVDTETTKATTQVYTYSYDALGRRIAKTDAFGITTFLWDGDSMVLEQRGGNEIQTIYKPGTFAPLAQIQNGTLHHIHTDHLGTPLEATNDDGKITWKVTYKTWGNVVTQEVEEIQLKQRFQGQYFDSETGLHYNRFRYYDPGQGRFVSQDPIGLMGGGNLYQYAPNPNNWTDPFGLSAWQTAWESASGMKLPADHQVHHIIPKDEKVLKEVRKLCPGFDEHEASNLIALPSKDGVSNPGGEFFGKQLHNGFHAAYNQTVIKALQVAQRFNKKGVTGCMKIAAIQKALKGVLQEGGPGMYKNKNPTAAEDWAGALGDAIRGR